MRGRLLILFSFFSGLLWAAQPVVKIGAIFPMTGELGMYGETLRNAITMAQEDMGVTALNYNFIYEDDRGEPKSAVLAAKKLVAVDNVNAVMTMWDDWFVVAPTTDPREIPHLGISWDYGRFRSPYNFNRYPTTGGLCEKFFEECARRGIRRVAFVALKGGGSLVMAKSAKEAAPRYGVEITLSEFVNPGDKDFRTFIAKILDTKPDALMLIMWPPTIDIFLRQYHEYRSTIPVAGIEIWFQSQMKKEFDGSWEVSSDVPGTPFALSFEKRWGREPIANAGHAYDNAMLIMRAHEALFKKLRRVPTGREVVAWFKANPTFDGAQGPTTINENNQIVSAPAVLELHHGKSVKVR